MTPSKESGSSESVTSDCILGDEDDWDICSLTRKCQHQCVSYLILGEDDCINALWVLS